MISLAEVRLALGDNEIGEVSLLDEFEFDDTEIVAAIRWVVDKWNDTPPPVSRYDYFNFPSGIGGSREPASSCSAWLPRNTPGTDWPTGLVGLHRRPEQGRGLRVARSAHVR